MVIPLIVLFFWTVYLARVITIYIAAKKHRQKFNTINYDAELFHEQLPTVSVIVPARDEENNIIECLNSIINSNYPKDKFEIVVINDRSTDNTLELINSIKNQASVNIVVCDIKEEGYYEKSHLLGKPRAIKEGIDMAKGDIFLLTDADCVVKPDWIYNVVWHFIDGQKDNIGMVCGYTTLKTTSMFHCFQAAEWTYMHTYGCAGVYLDTVLGCFGNNISLTRTAYETVGTYNNLRFSVTEDYVLLDAVHKSKFSVRYLCSNNTAVETLPLNTFKQYLKQRKRWALGALDLGWKAVVYVFSSVCLWIAAGVSIWSENWYLLFGSCVLRMLGDIFILFPIFRILKINYLKKYIPLSVCFYTVVEFILPFLIIDQKIDWKDQMFYRKK